MFNIFKKSAASALLNVSYKFTDDKKIYTMTATSSGLASLAADPYIIILEAVKA